jgi:hypothetical protein
LVASPSDNLRLRQWTGGDEIEDVGMPSAAKIKVMVVILLIGIASPFLGST